MTIFKNLENTDKDLDELVEILCRNVVTNSFPVGKAAEPLQQLLVKGMSIGEVRTRNILVLGAGASHNVHPDIALAHTAIGIVRQAFSTTYGPKILKFIDKKVHEVVIINGLNAEDFETQLLACSELDKELVLKELTKLYSLRYPVSLFYEIIAHLFKHRFIDVIINFNFDEMLDNAIEEEMKENQYRFIYSDGHCTERVEQLLHDHRLSCPIYIKPHGTISHPSTLRFTRKAYYKIPARIKETIQFLIEGINDRSTEDDQGRTRQERLPVNLIVAGFGLKSIEFNSLLTEFLEKERGKLFYFDVLRNERSIVEKLPADLKSFSDENSYLFPISHVEYGNRRLDDWFYLLWQKINSSFIKTCQPKDITRHVILHHIFNPVAGMLLSGVYSEAQYFRDRTIIEMALEILNSSDGLVNLVQIQQSRVQKYFSLMKEKDVADTNLFHFLKMFNLSIYKDYLKDTWYFNPEDEHFKKNLLTIIIQNASPKIRESIEISYKKARFREYGEKLLNPKRLFLTVHNTVKNNHISVFQQVNRNDILETDIKWIYTFQNYFQSDWLRRKWNLVLSITETGGIFTSQAIKPLLSHKKMMLICAHDSNMPKAAKREILLNQKLADIRDHIVCHGGQRELRMLPFREHNQHVVLFTDVKDGKMELVGGIYYSRRHMSKWVTPIHIHTSQDLQELLAIFVNYWDRTRKIDHLDIIQEAVREGRLTDAVKAMAADTRQRSFKEIQEDIIQAYYADR